jgi:hypothetical protein
MEAGDSSSSSSSSPACSAGAAGECTGSRALECTTDEAGTQQCTSRSSAAAAAVYADQLPRTASNQDLQDKAHAQMMINMKQKQQQFAQEAQQRRRLLNDGNAVHKHAPSRSIDQWFSHHADFGTFQSSNGSLSSNNSGVFVVSAGLGSNSNSSSSDAILLAGTTRQPEDFTLHDLRMSILTLAVAVAVATLLQGLVVGVWKLLRLNPDNLPM